MTKPRFLAEGATDKLQVVAGVFVPHGYEVWSDGVWMKGKRCLEAEPDVLEPLPFDYYGGRKRISQRAFWISGLGTTLDTNEPLIRLSYFTLLGDETYVWLTREQITDDRKIATLGGHGLPFDVLNARQVVGFLQTMEALNAKTLPHHPVGNRSGQYLLNGKIGWLVGQTWIGPGHLDADPRGGHRYFNAYATKGSYDLWLAKYKEVKECGWVARFVMAAGFASPLLSLIKMRTFIVHHYSDSGVGKTAAAQLALSIYGNPKMLYGSMNTTVVAMTELFKHTNNLPVLYDEKQVAHVDGHELIYSVCLEQSRDRGAKEGGVRNDRVNWNCIARTTGEQPLIGDGDMGGQFNRIMQIHSPAFANKEFAASLYDFAEQNHGHAGQLYLTHLAELVNAEGGLAALHQMYKELKEALTNRVGFYTNHTGYAALIALGQVLSDIWLLGIDRNEAMERALDDAQMAWQETAPTKQLAYAERALSRFRDHYFAHPMEYINDMGGPAKGQQQYHVVGVRATEGIVYLPYEADQILISAGYVPTRVWRDFNNLGWLHTDDDGGVHKRLNMGGGISRNHLTYFIRSEAFFKSEGQGPQLQLVSGGLSNPVRGLES